MCGAKISKRAAAARASPGTSPGRRCGAGRPAAVEPVAIPMLALRKTSLPRTSNGSSSASRIAPASAVDVDRSSVLDQDRELVAAEARRGVAGAHAAQQPLADRDEQLVAGGVAEAVVDRLELVEVAEQDRRRCAPRARARASAWRGGRASSVAVREAGERVVERLVDRVLDGAGVGQGHARVLGEGDEDLALGLPSRRGPGVAGDDEAADDLAALADRRRHRRADAVGRATWSSAVGSSS